PQKRDGFLCPTIQLPLETVRQRGIPSRAETIVVTIAVFAAEVFLVEYVEYVAPEFQPLCSKPESVRQTSVHHTEAIQFFGFINLALKRSASYIFRVDLSV